MRGVIFIVLLGFMGTVLAITKCELKGKVIYKTGTCPKNASTKFLVKGNYVAKQSLQKHKQQRAQEAERAFDRLNNTVMLDKLSIEEQIQSVPAQSKPRVVEISNESAHFQLQKVKRPVAKLNNVVRPVVVNAQLLEMEEQIKEHERALQQLQSQ